MRTTIILLLIASIFSMIIPLNNVEGGSIKAAVHYPGSASQNNTFSYYHFCNWYFYLCGDGYCYIFVNDGLWNWTHTNGFNEGGNGPEVDDGDNVKVEVILYSGNEAHSEVAW